MYYSFPKYSASYRFVKPLTNMIDEIKLRAAWGQSGNRPNFGARDVTIANGGVIGSAGSLVASTGLGNPAIKPEVMNELEYGVDASFWNQRIGLEFTAYDRQIKDLLLTFPLPASSGLGSQVINGGQLSVKGIEGSLTVIPLRGQDFEWTARLTYGANVQRTDAIPVPALRDVQSLRQDSVAP